MKCPPTREMPRNVTRETGKPIVNGSNSHKKFPIVKKNEECRGLQAMPNQHDSWETYTCNAGTPTTMLSETCYIQSNQSHGNKAGMIDAAIHPPPSKRTSVKPTMRDMPSDKENTNKIDSDTRGRHT